MAVVQSKNRDQSIDIVAGIMIIYMILYHIYQWSHIKYLLVDYLSHFLFMFMTWFYFKAGMFSHKEFCKDLVNDSSKRLLKPYFIFSLIGHVFWCIQQSIIAETSWKTWFYEPFSQIFRNSSVEGNLPLWFLLSLFIVKMLHSLFLKFKISDVWLRIVSIFVSFMLVYIMREKRIPLIFIQVSLGTIFFSVGHFFKEIQYRRFQIILLSQCFFCFSLVTSSFVENQIYLL